MDSSGVGDWHVGQPPDRRAVAVAARHGVDIAGLRARRIVSADFERFDVLLCADRSVLAAVERLRPAAARAEAALLLEWAGLGAGREVPDPYCGDEASFDAVFALLAGAADAILARVQEASAGADRTPGGRG